MEITVEISYYPLMELYQKPVDNFIRELSENKNITMESGIMSSVVTGLYEEVMNLLQQKLKPFMEKYPSVFCLKISNSCACKNP